MVYKELDLWYNHSKSDSINQKGMNMIAPTNNKPLGMTFLDEKKRVVALMESSQTEQQWNDNCDAVKREFGGYPEWWFLTIVISGVLKRVAARWGDDGEIKVVPMTFAQ
jgi:hypothetical protein